MMLKLEQVSVCPTTARGIAEIDVHGNSLHIHRAGISTEDAARIVRLGATHSHIPRAASGRAPDRDRNCVRGVAGAGVKHIC